MINSEYWNSRIRETENAPSPIARNNMLLIINAELMIEKISREDANCERLMGKMDRLGDKIKPYSPATGGR